MPPQPTNTRSAATGGVVNTGSAVSEKWSRKISSIVDASAPPATASTTRAASSTDAYRQIGP
jgi:hypothetical protein